jgi:glycosidase
MQYGHQLASDAVPHHRRTEIILLVCALTFKEQAYPHYKANWKCKKQTNETTFIPEPISSP